MPTSGMKVRSTAPACAAFARLPDCSEKMHGLHKMKIALAGCYGGETYARLVVDRDVILTNEILRFALQHSPDGECTLFFPENIIPNLKRWLLSKSAPSEWIPVIWLSSVLQVSEMLCEPENQEWIQRLADTVKECLRVGAVERRCTSRASRDMTRARDGQVAHREQSSLEARKITYAAILQALCTLPDATVDSVLRVVIHRMGGIRDALGVAPLALQRMLVSASLSRDRAEMSLSISPITLYSPGRESCSSVAPLCILPGIDCKVMRSLELTASHRGKTVLSINDADNTRAFIRTLAFATRLTSLSLTEVGCNGDTLDVLRADTGLVGRLEALSLSGEISTPETLQSLGALLRAATSLMRLELLDHSPFALPVLVKPSGKRTARKPKIHKPPPPPSKHLRRLHGRAFHQVLAAATRVTHLSLRTTCMHLPSLVELPRLRSLQADFAVCDDGHVHHSHGVPLSRALRCPQVHTVELCAHACEYCRLPRSLQLGDVTFDRQGEPQLMAPDPVAPALLRCADDPLFPQARTLTVRDCQRGFITADTWQELAHLILHTPGVQRLVLDDASGMGAHLMLCAASKTHIRSTLQHVSLIPRHGIPSGHWTARGTSAACAIGQLRAFQNLQSALLPLSCRLHPRAWIGNLLLHVRKCTALTLVKSPCSCAESLRAEGQPDPCAQVLWWQFSVMMPLPHIRDLELAGMRFDRGCRGGTERWLAYAFAPLSGVTTLRLRTVGYELEGLHGPISHQVVAAAAVPKMPQLQTIEMVSGQGAEEECAVLFPLPQAAPQEQAAVEIAGLVKGRKRGRGCGGCGCELEAEGGACPPKWRRRTT